MPEKEAAATSVLSSLSSARNQLLRGGAEILLHCNF